MTRHECVIINKVAYRIRSVDFVPYARASMQNHIGLFCYALSNNQRERVEKCYVSVRIRTYPKGKKKQRRKKIKNRTAKSLLLDCGIVYESDVT